jgi:hypothetical protein
MMEWGLETVMNDSGWVGGFGVWCGARNRGGCSVAGLDAFRVGWLGACGCGRPSLVCETLIDFPRPEL